MSYIKLKEFRQVKGLYQSSLARIMGTTQSVISRMEIRAYAQLTAPQYNRLCEEFGKEDVDNYCTNNPAVVVSGNINEGAGSQYNGINDNPAALEIIRKQTDTITDLSRKNAEQMDRLLSILEKLTGNESNR